ncbi:hypothetical protein AND_000131 [Anopheles darlingi]|uniref:Uncharacterized protein n=1 Tax=Anopheles darlingi TaxID=43151 RepID=W5JXB2_ANODA|nr:hypothetical protein AND_000131 [Anopheles darlingi]
MIAQEDIIIIHGMTPETTEEEVVERFGSVGVIKHDMCTQRPKVAQQVAIAAVDGGSFGGNCDRGSFGRSRGDYKGGGLDRVYDYCNRGGGFSGAIVSESAVQQQIKHLSTRGVLLNGKKRRVFLRTAILDMEAQSLVAGTCDCNSEYSCPLKALLIVASTWSEKVDLASSDTPKSRIQETRERGMELVE